MQNASEQLVRAMTRAGRFSGVAVLLAPLVQAQTTPLSGLRPVLRPEPEVRLFVVDDEPSPCRFSASLQDAVDAAADGDVILLGDGDFWGDVTITKDVTVIGQGAAQTLVLGRVNVSSGRLLLRNVWLEDLESVLSASTVLLEDCRLDCTPPASPIYNVREGSLLGASNSLVRNLSSYDSEVFLYFTEARGAPGTNARAVVDYYGNCTTFNANSGRMGLHVNGGSAYLVHSTIQGGDGGHGWSCQVDPIAFCTYCPDCLDARPGGVGLWMQRTPGLLRMETVVTGGYHGQGGCTGHSGVYAPDVSEAAGHVDLPAPGTTANYNVSSPVAHGTPAQVVVEGPPGWAAFIAYDFELQTSYDPARFGYSVLSESAPTIALGEIPPSGMLQTTLPTDALLRPGDQARVLYTQLRVYDPSNGVPKLGSPSTLVVLRYCF